MSPQTTKTEKYRLQADIRRSHEKRLMRMLMERGAMSRTALARALHISLPGVSQLTERLLGNEYLVWEERPEISTVGRPAIRLYPAPEKERFVAISFRRGYALAVRFNMQMRPQKRIKIPYPVHFFNAQERLHGFPLVDADDFCDFTEVCLRKAAESPVRAVLLSMPGKTIEHDNCFASTPLGLAIGGDFLNRLRARVPAEVSMGNDSGYFSYAQKQYGQPDTYAFVNHNVGVGAGIIQEGRLFRSGSHYAAEIGHVSIDYGGIPCTCGSRGCLERYVGFGAITGQARERLGKDLSIAQIAQAFLSGDAIIHGIMNDVAKKLAVGLSSMLSVFEVPRILLGGGIECFGDGFLGLLRDAMATSARYTVRDVAVRYSDSADKDDCIGALKYYLDETWQIQTQNNH